ncbi:MAG: hypothetical protein AAGJ31_09350, partial [Verrucomicrobiota bacterium]
GRLLEDLISYLRNVLVACVDSSASFPELAEEVASRLQEQKGLTTPDRLLNLIDHLAATEAKMKWSTNKALHFEIGAIKGMQILSETNLSDVIHLLHEAGAAVSSSSSVGQERSFSASKKASPSRGREAAKAKPESQETQGEGEEEQKRPPKKQRSRPTGPVEGVALWSAILEEIEAEKPLLSGWAKAGVFQEQTPRKLVIGFSAQDAFAKDSLLREKSRVYVEELIKSFHGKSLTLVGETVDGLEPLADREGGIPEPEDEDPSEPEPPTSKPPPEVPPSRSEPVKQEVAPEASAPLEVDALEKPREITPPEPLDEKAFRNDQMIQEALRLFEGELED